MVSQSRTWLSNWTTTTINTEIHMCLTSNMSIQIQMCLTCRDYDLVDLWWDLLLSCSAVSNSVTPWTATCQAFLSFTISRSLLKLVSIELVMPSNHLVVCCPLLLLPSIFPSIRVFSNQSALCIRWPKYWSFSISPSNEYSELISFRIDWFDLLAVWWD